MPRAPRVCAELLCTNVATCDGRCDDRQLPTNWARYPSANFRTLTRSDRQQFRAAVLAREPWCRNCGARATQADHITSIGNGGANDPVANGQGLCGDCHDAKTRADRRR